MSANQQVLSSIGGQVVGQYLYALFSDNVAWTVPAGVTSISVVCVGPGTSSNSAFAAHGGCLRYVNNISVTPGETLYIDCRDNGARLRRGSTVLCYGPRYENLAQAIGTGGNGGTTPNPGSYNSGGGGAGGYSGNGGIGGSIAGSVPGAGSGGGGGGGAGNLFGGCGGGGGGVGVFGIGSNGAAGTGVNTTTPGGGGGGSGGTGGLTGDRNAQQYPVGGNYGGGGGRYNGAVRIIWPGNLRQFPSTRTANE